MINKFSKQKISELQEQGVVFIDPEHTYIDQDTVVGAGTIIYPNVILENCTVGINNTITLSSHLVNSHIGDGNQIESSKIINSRIGNHNQVGPYAHLREKTEVFDGARIGNFVEVKNSVLHDGVKVSHLSYLGDSQVGARSNLGCGTITVNYDGFTKNPTIIGEDCLVGCNSNLIAPVQIGDRVIVGAGTTVTKDLSSESLAISRPTLMEKPQYYQKWKQKGASKDGIKK